MRVLFTFRN